MIGNKKNLVQDLQDMAEYVAEKIKTAFNNLPTAEALRATRQVREELRLLEAAKDMAIKIGIDEEFPQGTGFPQGGR